MPDLDGTLCSGKTSLKKLLILSMKKTSLNEDDVLDENEMDPSVVSFLDQNLDKGGNPTGPKQTRNNLYKILRRDRRWRDAIWENQFAGSLKLKERDYKDTDDTRIALWIDRAYGLKYSNDAVANIAKLIGEENGRNPLQDWLSEVNWDGACRIEDWIIRATGCDDTELNRNMGKKWLIQAIARAFRPGIKADCVLILIGPQGAKKSSLLRTLATDEYFSDTPLDIGSANAYSQIRRAWIYEVAELDSVRRSANSATKAFISAQEDNFRPAYGRHAVTVKRHVVFAGTTNESQFINDMTGSRRYWPIMVGDIDLAWVQEHRDQLWAEALVEYKAGETWWLEESTEKKREKESLAFRQDDPWAAVLDPWLTSNFGQTISTRTIMEEALKLEKYQMNRRVEMRIAEIMNEFGYRRVRKRMGGTRVYSWEKNTEVINMESPQEA